MITIAIFAVLVAIALPNFFRTSYKTRASSEIVANFAELSAKEDRWKIDTNLNSAGTYLTAASCPGAASNTAVDISACQTGVWAQLGVNLPVKMSNCTYQLTAGPAGTSPAPPAPFTLPANPAVSWYFIVATCDFNPNVGQSTYLTSSLDPKIQKNNEGD